MMMRRRAPSQRSPASCFPSPCSSWRPPWHSLPLPPPRPILFVFQWAHIPLHLFLLPLPQSRRPAVPSYLGHGGGGRMGGWYGLQLCFDTETGRSRVKVRAGGRSKEEAPPAEKQARRFGRAILTHTHVPGGLVPQILIRRPSMEGGMLCSGALMRK